MAQDLAGLPSGAALRTVVRNRQAIGLDVRLLAVVAFLAAIAGFGQAALLIVVVRAATALTADTALISGDIGPISATDLTVDQLIIIGFVVLCVLLVAEVGLAYFQAKLQEKAQRTSRRRVLAAFAGAAYPEQIALPRGDIQAVIAGHTQQASLACSLLSLGVVGAVNFMALVGSAVVLSPTAALIVVVGLLAILTVLRPLLTLSRRAAEVRTNAVRRLGRVLIERLELSREIRAFGVDQQATAPTLVTVDDVAAATRKVRFLNRTNQALYRLGAFGMVLAMLAIIEGNDARNLAALTGALLMLLRSLTYGQAVQKSYQAMNEAVPVILQLVAETERLEDHPTESGSLRRPDHIGALRVDAVGFAYPDDDQVLSDINFEVEPGELVAIVGPSGSGKSTIMALLLRLRDPDAGTISASGTDITTIDPSWWHQRVAYVPQEPRLQDGTVADAIRFYRDWVTDDDVRDAAAMAHVADEIESWSDGYETQVGQLGDQVSGGQRQRLALARALAGKPELLLLDEPTSALDPTSEMLIGQTLEELAGSMTIIAIAHRINTVESATRVVHVRDGRIVPHHGDDQAELRRVLEA